MAIKLGGGGGGGAQINEIGVFVDQGDVFTDSNGAVWLKKGSRTLDTTTYPDALSQNAAVSNATDFQSAHTMGSTSPWGLTTSEDGAWALSSYTYNSNQYAYLDIASDTPTHNPYWPSLVSGYSIVDTEYIKCRAASGVESYITNANNYFAACLAKSSSGPIRIQFCSLVGGSGTSAGLPDTNKGIIQLSNSAGANLGTIVGYGEPAQASSMYWDSVGRKMYVMFGYTTSKLVLYVYNWSAQTFGYTSINVAANLLNASQEIDWRAQMPTDDGQAYNLSGDSTHLYLDYYKSGVGRVIRKFPLSGNLSWSSGSEIGVLADPATGGNGQVLKLSSSNTGTTVSIRGGANYFKTVDSVLKFVMFDTPRNVSEFAINVPIIGEGTPDYRHAKTQYQRIK